MNVRARNAVLLGLAVAGAIAVAAVVVLRQGANFLGSGGSHAGPISVTEIREFMASHYGRHDAANKRWILKSDYASDGGLESFHAICASLPVTNADGPRVLLAVCNNSTSVYTGANYSEDPATVDLYELARRNGRIAIVAKLESAPLKFPGVAGGSVIRLGQDLYAFDFSGEVSFHEAGCGADARELYAPQGNTFTEVLSIASYDSDGDTYEVPSITQTVEFTLDNSQPDRLYYPLVLTVDTTTRAPQEFGSDAKPAESDRQKTYRADFNPKAWGYALPANMYAGKSQRQGC